MLVTLERQFLLRKSWAIGMSSRLEKMLKKAEPQLRKVLLPKPSRQQALQAVRTLIHFIGEDPDRQGVSGTPDRVIRAWEQDWGIGYDEQWLNEQFDSVARGKFDDGAEDYSNMVFVRNLSFTSHCEHHMAPFQGFCSIAYIPGKKGPILGLSKLPRIVDMFSRRLQVQERLTSQIADFVEKTCDPLGVGVIIKATHGCMMSRGVRQAASDTVTSALRGEMMNKPEVRAEFLKLVGV